MNVTAPLSRRTRAVRAVFLAITLGGLATEVPASYWPLEANSSFGAYYFFAFALMVLCLILGALRSSPRWRWWLLALSVVLCTSFLPGLAPFYLSTQSPALGTSRVLRLFYANINQDNLQKSLIRSLIEREEPDVVAILEPDHTWIESLNLRSGYPNHIEMPRDDRFGIALYSKMPIKLTQETELGEGLPPIISVQLQRENEMPISFVAAHFPPPLSSAALSTAKLMARRLSTVLRHQPGNVIVAADLNASPFSSIYTRIAGGAYLTHVLYGRGLQKTWHADKPMFNLTIDHVLYKGRLTTTEARVVPLPGSDHNGYVVDFWSAEQSQQE